MKNIKDIIIIILFGIILFQFTFRKPTKIKYNTKTDTISVVYDSISYIPKPYIIYKDTGSYHLSKIYVTNLIDTNAIISNYIKKIVYSDTLKNDSLAFILIHDTLQYNRILNRTKVIHIYTLQKTLVQPIKEHLFAGFGIGGGKSIFGVTGNIALLTKRKRLYFFSYDILNHSIFVSIYWKLH